MSSSDKAGEAAAVAASVPAGKEVPVFEISTSRQFPNWLASTGGSLAISTYQSSKVILVGTNKETRRISVFERTLERAMGMAFDG